MRKKWILPILMACICVGCGEVETEDDLQLKRQIYEKYEYETVPVEIGELTPYEEYTLQQEESEKIPYSVGVDGLKVEELLVDVGDRVEKGQLLASFGSKELVDKIEEYQNEIESKNLILEHFTRLRDMKPNDKNRPYDVVIEETQDDLLLLQSYLAEVERKYDDCMIYASENGTITYISKDLLSGLVEPGKCLIEESLGNSRYFAKLDPAMLERTSLQVGQEYTVSFAEEEALFYLAEFVDENKAVFYPKTGYVGEPDEKGKLIIQKESRNCTYIPSSVIKEHDGKPYVYLVDENGFFEAKYIEVLDTVDNMTILGGEWNGTEKVAVKTW